MLGWTHPASLEWLKLADLFDVTAHDKRGKPAKTSRPWPSKKPGVRRGHTTLPSADAIALLAKVKGREVPTYGG